MKLHVTRLADGAPIFWLDTSFAEREVAKTAGFLWHGDNHGATCGACAASLGKVWWTRRIEAARGVAEHAANDEARAAIGGDGATRENGAVVEIPDPSFNLALLSALIFEEIIPRPNLALLQAKHRPSRDELEADDEDYVGEDAWMYVFNHRLADELLATPITAAQLAKLRELHWPERPWFDRVGRPSTLVGTIFPQWSGEEGEFDIRDLSGIERCTGLEVVSLWDSVVDGAAKKQLARLPAHLRPKGRAKAKKPKAKAKKPKAKAKAKKPKAKAKPRPKKAARAPKQRGSR